MKKKYDKAKTPYTRVMESDLIGDSVKETLRKQKASLNIIDLKRQVETALEKLLATVVKSSHT